MVVILKRNEVNLRVIVKAVLIERVLNKRKIGLIESYLNRVNRELFKRGESFK